MTTKKEPPKKTGKKIADTKESMIEEEQKTTTAPKEPASKEQSVIEEEQKAITAPKKPPSKKQPSTVTYMPIIGIGASAGGLEAFEQFFSHLPPSTGIAFVIAQHLDPTHKSILNDLIKRYTQMPVDQVKDGVEIQENHVYIMPPNREMELMHGKLHLLEPVAPRGFRLPIDSFFRSLSNELKEKAICVVLSGTGNGWDFGAEGYQGGGGHGHGSGSLFRQV